MTPSERTTLLNRWIQRSSDAEQARQERAERMVRAAIDAWPYFEGIKPLVYAKGSYPNNTNVRQDSDVDVVVECNDCIYWDNAPGVHRTVSGVYTGPWDYKSWRAHVAAALIDAYGEAGVDTSGNIAINLPEVAGSRPSTDVVPSHGYHLHTGPYSQLVGSVVWSTDGKRIVNWPEQQLQNGRAKNTATNRRYKRMVRALKNVENRLAHVGRIDELPSYFMECLVYNVPNSTLIAGSIDDAFKGTLLTLYGGISADRYGSWTEPNGIKPLFNGGQSWTPADAVKLIDATYDLLGY